MHSLRYEYSGVYLQSLWTDGMGVVEIRRKGIYLDKTTKPYKETDQMVWGSPGLCLLVGKAAEEFSSPTLTDLKPFGNTKKPSFQIRSIFWLISVPRVPSVAIVIVIKKLIPTGDMLLICSRNLRKNRSPLPAFCAKNMEAPFLYCPSSWSLIFSIRSTQSSGHCF